MKDKLQRQPSIHRKWIREGKLTEEESERAIREAEYYGRIGYQAQIDSLEEGVKGELVN